MEVDAETAFNECLYSEASKSYLIRDMVQTVSYN